MTIAERIAFLRRRLGLSQKTFGERIGKSAGYVSKAEGGRIAPTQSTLQTIAETFDVPMNWIATGEGRIEIESIGERMKAARKARGYTQEELAAEMHISRNSVGMIERGVFRPGEEIIDSLCLRLRVDRNWLLTGVGQMERTELTPFYELLKRDPLAREQIRSFIDHLDRNGMKKRATQDHEPKNSKQK